MYKISMKLAICAGLALSVSSASSADQPFNKDNDPYSHRGIKVISNSDWQNASQKSILNNDTNRGVAHTSARLWNDLLLDSIRRDFARPTIHSRNLYHTSAAMWDAWAAYDEHADQIFISEKLSSKDIATDRDTAISYAMYRLLRHRFATSPAAVEMYPRYDLLMDEMGYDKAYEGTVGNDAASLGNRIAQTIITFGMTDGANEQNDYENLVYVPLNPPLLPDFPGNPDIIDVDRWQPLALEYFKDQSGNPIPTGYPDFLGPEWGDVTPFSLNENDVEVYERDGHSWSVWADPGLPPYFEAEQDRYKWGFEMVIRWSGHLDPADNVMIDISPGSIGNAPLPTVEQEQEYYDVENGGDWGKGYSVNPVTGLPYEPQIVNRGDYTRILAEFWADGPDSETPPGHWFTVMKYVSDHALHENRFMGEGPILEDLEWDVKSFLVMGGGMHDSAISAWSVKGYYDYLRPISAIRYMCDQGQSTDPNMPSFSTDGVNLVDGAIELVSAESTAPGERHEHLAGSEGKIAIYAWRGPTFIDNPDTDMAGVGWILAENWWPYQRPSFVSPPFAGYVSGHSVFSRGAAEIMTLLTGSEYFPGGLGEFVAPMNEFLVFEEGPTMDITLQWATYQDASDQTSLSRIWGGIHPPADDIPGRHMGDKIGPEAFTEARRYFRGLKSCPADFQPDGVLNFFDIASFIGSFTSDDQLADLNGDGVWNFFDVAEFIGSFTQGCP
ncbi:MAG: vanadium-dependent haloperoxidase [Phycisphaerales bacterium]|nr:vanadium-dependent haloperoxidase [Phycisphaerales bacterium]